MPPGGGQVKLVTGPNSAQGQLSIAGRHSCPTDTTIFMRLAHRIQMLPGFTWARSIRHEPGRNLAGMSGYVRWLCRRLGRGSIADGTANPPRLCGTGRQRNQQNLQN